MEQGKEKKQGKKKKKIRNAFESNMSTDIKLPRAQISKIIQRGKFLEVLLRKRRIFRNVNRYFRS